MNVEIDRSRWLRGNNEGSMLRNPKSCHECCVGTIGRSAGIPAQRLESKPFIGGMDPAHVPRSLHEFIPCEPGLTRADDPREAPGTKKNRRRRRERKLVSDLMYSVNDDAALDDAAREGMLTALAASIGIRLTFTGEALPRHAVRPTGDGRTGQAAISRGHQRPHPPVRLVLATTILGEDREWEAFETATMTLDTDEETTEAYVYDLLRAHAHEQKRPVRVTAAEADSGRTVCDLYHEPA